GNEMWIGPKELFSVTGEHFAPPAPPRTSIEPFWLSTSMRPPAPSSSTGPNDVVTFAEPLTADARTAPFESSTVRSPSIRVASTRPKVVLTLADPVTSETLTGLLLPTAVTPLRACVTVILPKELRTSTLPPTPLRV